jgi:4-hydroxy-2-oxoheptanedioate aldolase
MRNSKVLAKLRAGEVARVCSMGTPIAFMPALAAQFKFDAVWLDGEHRSWSASELEWMLGRHHAADIDCVWRPPTREKSQLYRALEDGATGLMIPHVGSAEQARALVDAVKFPPLGDRGLCGGGRDAGYWVRKPADYVQRANEQTFLVVQIETPQALEQVDAIASVPGVEVLFLGPGDMSLRLGCTGAVKDPLMVEVQQKIAAACLRHGKFWGRPVGSASDAAALAEMGARFIAHGSDFGGLLAHLEACARDFDALGCLATAEPSAPEFAP